MPQLVLGNPYMKPAPNVVTWRVKRLPGGGYEGYLSIPMLAFQAIQTAAGNTLVKASRNGVPRTVPPGTVRRVHRDGKPLAVKAQGDTPEDALSKAAQVASNILDPSTTAGKILNEALPPGAGIALDVVKKAAGSDIAKKAWGAITSIF